MLQQGDKVFFSDNGESITDYSSMASRTIQTLGLTPLVYGGTGLNVRTSTLDKEIRDDFYQSKVVVLVLGKGEKWKSIGDNWAIPELDHAISSGIKCFVYITSQITEEEIRSISLPINPVIVRHEKHFGTILKQSLEQLLASS